MRRNRSYDFTPTRRQADKTFLVASLFEGKGYIGRFDNRTGERIGTVNLNEDFQVDINDPAPAEEFNEKQYSLF